MGAKLVPGPPLENPLECVETDVPYKIDGFVGTVITTGPVGDVTLPDSPFPGVPYTIVADGGDCSVHGGAFPIQNGDFSLPQGQLTFLIWSDASQTWSKKDPGNTISVAPDLYVNAQIGKDSNNGLFPVNGVDHKGPFKTFARLQQLLGFASTIVLNGVGTGGPGALTIHVDSGVLPNFSESDPFTFYNFLGPGVFVRVLGTPKIIRSTPITAVQTKNRTAPAGGTPWAITVAGGLVDAFTNGYSVQVLNANGSGLTAKAWAEKDLGAGKTQMSEWITGTFETGINIAAPVAAPAVGNTVQVIDYTRFFLGEISVSADATESTGQGLLLEGCHFLKGTSGNISSGVLGSNLRQTLVAFADCVFDATFNSNAAELFVANPLFRAGANFVGNNNIEAITQGAGIALIAGAAVNTPGTIFNLIQFDGCTAFIDGDFGLIGSQSTTGELTWMQVQNALVQSGAINAWDTSNGIVLQQYGQFNSEFFSPIFGDFNYPAFWGVNPNLNSDGVNNAIVLFGAYSNLQILQLSPLTASIQLPNIVFTGQPTQFSYPNIAANNLTQSYPFNLATGALDPAVNNSWANLRVDRPVGFRDQASIPNVQSEGALSNRPDCQSAQLLWSVTVSPGP